jgi:hypothetical protein
MNHKRKGRRASLILCNWLGRVAGVLLLVVAQAGFANASVALLMEEPYGEFGAMNPTGHSAVYLNHICASSAATTRSADWTGLQSH